MQGLHSELRLSQMNASVVIDTAWMTFGPVSAATGQQRRVNRRNQWGDSGIRDDTFDSGAQLVFIYVT
jgi:hypothetical protein